MLKQLLLGSVMTLATITGANALIIDDFIDAPQLISIAGPEDADIDGAGPDTDTDGPGPFVNLLDNAGGDTVGDPGPHASIIGGYRDIKTTLVGSPSRSRSTDSEAALTNGEFAHSQETGVRSNSYITWDGLRGAGLGSADLTDGGLSFQFHLIVNSADDGVDWSLELFDSNSSFLYEFSNVGDILSPTHMFLAFSSFSGIDFTDINKIVFGANVTSTVDFDTSVALLETVGVPEPASMTLLGAGIMGLGAIKRRRQTA